MKLLLLNLWQLLSVSSIDAADSQFTFNDSSVVNRIEISISQTVDRDEILKRILVKLNQKTTSQEIPVAMSHRVYHISPFGAKPLGRIYFLFHLEVEGQLVTYALSNFQWKEIKRNRYGRFIETIRGRKKDLSLFDKRLSSSQKLAITQRINFELGTIRQHLKQILKSY